ncbi:MAG: hypothetical protein GQ547_05405 [Methylophaga sp.]|nr:hypothetical protein [Methylophaga sp.]
MKVTRKPTLGFDENNIEYEAVPRRQSERRGNERRQGRPIFASIEKIRQLRKVDNQALIPLRLGERRQKDRRKSRLSFLTIEEIKALRKK